MNHSNLSPSATPSFLSIYWLKHMFRNWKNFSGRANRTEFWSIYIYASIVGFTVMAVLAVPILLILLPLLGEDVAVVVFIVMLFVISIIANIPYISASTRRLHDTGRSGWWLALAIAPLGGYVVMVFWFLEGDNGDNRYGARP